MAARMTSKQWTRMNGSHSSKATSDTKKAARAERARQRMAARQQKARLKRMRRAS